MQIRRSGPHPPAKGPAVRLGGSPCIEPPPESAAPAREGGARVTFEPGCRTPWHMHPLGQTLVVASGCGWVQHEGGTIEVIRPGDVVWLEPGERHWHGATATTAMTHIAIQEQLDGKAVDWLARVGDLRHGA
ncbi:MAG: cupin domain-containing protein [Armatimonadetes bacterium]|nr:cupin domain-containing protein [Armatimonadota bacterium]